ncbi:xanthine phosphoribosyltransferase [Alicyclobacillus sp. SO9]|uniref:xanthine phosphoribosyltransferase n=1 Tax=Alicyclobacillus sp. SO9 TaxID=2665646 RepID=UPI0018E71BF2|nr:xanthine phosphoribosyltransferase [Alicyclobacillus sp. SO9]QQE79844.1 xanthine phosphoribosyltransferase [Alicyclobacillus sp. SO9]
MQYLHDYILKEGRVLSSQVLKVDSFLNHQVQPTLIQEIGREFANAFANSQVDKVITVEASGIHIAYATALALGVPFVYAKKKRAVTQSDDVFSAPVMSYTRNETVDITVSKSFIRPGERVLVIDDILANGNAVMGLLDILQSAEANVVALGVVIEKRFQDGRAKIQARNIPILSLASIESMENGRVVFTDSEESKMEFLTKE